MSDDIYDNDFGTESEGMMRETMEMTVVVFESIDHGRGYDFNKETNTHKPLQRTVKIRNYTAAVVGLVLLCVFLLTAVIVLCVNVYGIRKNYPTVVGKDQFTDNPKWITYKQSSYYISSEWKNWTESRQDCLQRGADLVIINNEEEQEYIKRVTSGNIVWIGLTDSDKEMDWKWVDGSTLNTSIWSFWGLSEPNSKVGDEDCVVSFSKLADYPCNYTFVWICERNLEV